MLPCQGLMGRNLCPKPALYNELRLSMTPLPLNHEKATLLMAILVTKPSNNSANQVKQKGSSSKFGERRCSETEKAVEVYFSHETSYPIPLH